MTKYVNASPWDPLQDGYHTDTILRPHRRKFSFDDRPPYRALVAGATGAVGQHLVALFLADPMCLNVTALTRREDLVGKLPQSLQKEVTQGRLTVTTMNWDRLVQQSSHYASVFHGQNYIAMCVGGATRNESEKIDTEYVRAFVGATKAHADSLRHYSQISIRPSRYIGLGALTTKDIAEQSAVRCLFPRTSIWCPSRIDRGDKASWREKGHRLITGWYEYVGFFPSAIPAHSLAVSIFLDFHRAEAQRRPSAPVRMEISEIWRLVNLHM